MTPTTEAGRFDWHDSQCGEWDGTGLDGEAVHLPCDCGMPEMFRSAVASARDATIAAIRARVEGLRHEPERGMGQRGWNAALAAIQRIREGASDGR